MHIYHIYILALLNTSCLTQFNQSANTTKEDQKDQKAFSITEAARYGTLTRQYRGYADISHKDKPDMGAYELKLKRYLSGYKNVGIYKKENTQIVVTFPTNLIMETGIPAITPEAYFGVLSRFSYVLLTAGNTSIEIKGYATEWIPAQEKANAVAGYLCLKGISRQRITAIGFNTDKPFVEITLTPL